MAIKTLQGIRIVPKGNRFSTQNWDRGYAFGGWIYTADVSVGLSKEPTIISISVVLGNLGENTPSNQDFQNIPATFDINKSDLILGTSNGTESLFDIYINGKLFQDLVLYSFEKDISPELKKLSVVFKDYSLILDKIYVGLINRQGNKFVYRGVTSGEFHVKCPDCQMDGKSFIETSNLVRDVNFGSYAGVNGILVDNFSQIVPGLTSSFSIPSLPTPPSTNGQDKFNLNGGYLILGTEEIPQRNCGALPEVKYTFPELVWSLKARGINLMGDFPTTYSTQTKYYRQNYAGTLREVLQNWCSDFALDFHTSGKFFEAFDISKPIPVLAIMDVMDPTTSLGKSFDLTQPDAIGSYKETASLDNSYEQSVITSLLKAPKSEKTTKSIQRYVGFMPMHPIDLSYSNLTVHGIKQNAYGLDFITESHLNNFDLCDPAAKKTTITTCNNQVTNSFLSATPNRFNRFDRWTNRTFGDTDTSMALSHYNPDLRDIFAGTRIIESLQTIDPNRDASYNNISVNAKKDFDGHFKALGFQPITRVLDGNLKSLVLATYKDPKQGNSLDQEYFEIYLGYYNQQEYTNVANWEVNCAESMYKYGFLIQGTDNSKPYVPGDLIYNLSPSAGLLYGDQGVRNVTYSHSYEPSTLQYPLIQFAPYKNLIPFTGVNPVTTYSGAWIASLDNSWGTTKEYFDKLIEFRDEKCQQYSNLSVNEKLNDLDGTTKQSWDMSFFKPSFHAVDVGSAFSSSDIYLAFESVFESLAVGNQLGVDQISHIFYDNNGYRQYGCQKLHFCIIPITFNNAVSTYTCHPNGRFGFNPSCGQRDSNYQMYFNYQEQVRLEILRQRKVKVPSVCEISLEEELCRKALTKRSDQIVSGNYSCLYDQNNDISKYYCVVSPTGYYRVGFHPNYLDSQTNPNGNSRYLDVTIERNPVANIHSSFVPKDKEGNEYVEDLIDPSSLVLYNYAARSARIVYPIDSQPDNTNGRGTYAHAGYLYYGLMTTNAETENRIPPTIQIYGEPVNKINNNSSSIKIINHEMNTDLDPLIDPTTNQFATYTSVITGGNIQAIVTVQKYHEIISGLNNLQSNFPSQTVEFSILGEPSDIDRVMTPKSGLSSYSMSIGDNGVQTNIKFQTKPATLPKQESILNQITMRLPK